MMFLAFGGASIDGALYRDVADAAQDAPAWLDDVVSAWSTYGLLLFAVLMVVGWWRARRTGAQAALTALAVPVVVGAAYVVDLLLKLVVRENRPCRTLHVATLEACPGPGDWSFPSNHAAIAGAAAIALYFVSRRLGTVAAVAAILLAASRVWVGVHYPHDAAVGLALGALVAYGLMAVVRKWLPALTRLITATRLRPLLVS